MTRRAHVSVIGFNNSCTEVARSAAYDVGRAIARRGGIVVCGGLGGVMEAACRGAHDEGGLSVGIIPSANSGEANRYCDVVIPTGLGWSRDFLVANSGDAVVVVGGGAGTLTEVAAAYQMGKRIVAVRGTGGVADEWVGRHIDERKRGKVIGGATPDDAVAKAMKGLTRGR